ncbi:uncharacterized protein LOC119734288 isoform X2 [Patiria miniata]|nr:uncharacterized protein LOC119734288 isoform X2 [Patiria miniata]
MGRQMELQKTRTRQVIAGWKLRLQEGDEKVIQVAREKDEQFTELVSELMFIEGCLKKERREIVEKLNKRDLKIKQLEQTVKKQQKQIHALNKANEKLIGSLHDIRLETPDSSPSPSPVPDSGPEEEPCMENGEGLHSPHLGQFLRPGGMVPRQRASTVELLPSRRDRDRRRGIPNGSILAPNNNNKPQLDSDPHQQPHQHRVRFQDEVFEEDSPRKDFLDVEPMDMRIRKISLPAYRLPTDEEDSIRFF